MNTHTIMGLHILHPFPYMPRLGNPDRPKGKGSHRPICDYTPAWLCHWSGRIKNIYYPSNQGF
jgi:hypothetical protein